MDPLAKGLRSSCLGTLFFAFVLFKMVHDFGDLWVALQVVAAYAIGVATAKWNAYSLRRHGEHPGWGLGCSGVFVLLFGFVALGESWDVLRETWWHNQPGWGKADLVTYHYKSLHSYLDPALIAVAALGWVVTSAWLLRKPAIHREDL